MFLFRKIVFLAVFGFSFAVTAAFAQSTLSDDEKAIHETLKALNQRLVDAVNKKDGEAMIAELSKDVDFTAMNNDHVHGIEQMRAYYTKMLTGADKFLNDMSLTSVPDDLAKLYDNNQIAVATGISMTHFDIRGGLVFDVPLRWTATLEKTTGTWKLAAIHFSADVGSNPLLTAATAFWKWLAAGLAALGLLVGFFVGRKGRKIVG
jgi:uncharacterized protein (TIGR02246 family)